jgi:hypothetical protein
MMFGRMPFFTMLRGMGLAGSQDELALKLLRSLHHSVTKRMELTCSKMAELVSVRDINFVIKSIIFLFKAKLISCYYIKPKFLSNYIVN